MLNYDQITGMIRAIVPAIVAWLAGAGIIPQGAVANVTAAIIAILAAAWSVYNNQTGKTIQ